MIIDISKIVQQSNTSKKFNCSIDESSISYNHATYSIIECKPFELTVVNEGANTLSISGDTALKVLIPCDRCTADTEYDFDVVVDKSLKIADKKVLHQEDDELVFINDDELNVDKLIFDYVLVDWPAKVLCKEDCKGLCPMCGTNLNISSCDCKMQIKDPRMAKFQDIFDSFIDVYSHFLL